MVHPDTIPSSLPSEIDPTSGSPLDLEALFAIASGNVTPGPWHPGHLHRDDMTCNCAYVFSETCMGAVATVGVNNDMSISEGGNDDPPLEEAKANQLFIATFDPPTVRRLLALALRSSAHDAQPLGNSGRPY